MNPTRAEKLMWNRLTNEVGCIACRLDGVTNHNVSIHHIDGRTKPGAHSNVIPLCGAHHQTGGEDAPSIHPWKRRFEAKYGLQQELKAMCYELLANELEKETNHG